MIRHELNILLLTGGLLAGLVALHELGRRLRLHQLRKGGTTDSPASGVVDGAVFALLGLLIAFTFSGAASRFDDRRKLIVDEANAIGTAYLRIDLLPAAAQPEMRETFKLYLDARLAVYEALPDIAAAKVELERATRLQQAIWSKALAGAAGSQPATMLLLPALNEMFDIATTRTLASQMHPPDVIFGLLIGLALLAAVLAGYAMGGVRERSWVHVLAFACTLAGAVYVILDIEYPRLGLIRVDAFDQVLVDLRRGMK